MLQKQKNDTQFLQVVNLTIRPVVVSSNTPNFIQILPSFPNFLKLAIFNLQNNNISSIKQFCSIQYQYLNDLNLSYNQLGQMPMFNMPRLEKLRLNNNEIDSIEQFTLGKYSKLKQLQLSSNKLVKLPLINAKQLKYLTVSYNLLQSIEQFAKGSYENLHILSLSSNKLKQLPKINLNKNKNQLSMVSVENNLLQQIYEFTKGIYYDNISRLSISITKGIKLLPVFPQKIKCLSINNTNLIDSDIDQLFKFNKFQYLQQLTLEYNLFQKAPKLQYFCYNDRKLKELSLYNNPIKNVDEIFIEQERNYYLKLDRLRFTLDYHNLKQNKQFEEKKKQIENFITQDKTNQKNVFIQYFHVFQKFQGGCY